eukprot:m.107438 g.107438  ORF g.107438 m.107438 type:complete len:498 (+) comp8981_c0_seq2:20-1513(+)
MDHEPAPAPKISAWIAEFASWEPDDQNAALNLLVDELPKRTGGFELVSALRRATRHHLRRDFIRLLPEELALKILSYLDVSGLCAAAAVSREWRAVASHNQLWRPFCEAERIKETIVPILRSRRGLRDGLFSDKQAYEQYRLLQRSWCKGPLPPRKEVQAHAGHVITCLLITSHGLVSGSDDKTLRLWDLDTKSEIFTFHGHSGGVWCCAASGDRLISGSTDHTLRVWHLVDHRCEHMLTGHTSTVRCVRLAGDIAVSGSRDATLRVWDIRAGTCLGVLTGHQESVRCLEYDGRIVVSGSYDFTVRVWEPTTCRAIHTLHGHTNRVYSLQFEGSVACSGSLDMTIRVWDINMGVCLHLLHGHQSLTGLMNLSNGVLVSGNSDTTLRVWDVATGRCLHTLHGHTSAVTCLSVNGQYITSCSDDGTVRLWNLRTGQFVRTIADFNDPPPAAGTDHLVVWRVQCSADILACAVGRHNNNHSSMLALMDFLPAPEDAMDIT